MALVKVISSNLFGANSQKLAVGTEITVNDEVAERWEKAGLVEFVANQEFEVATPGEQKKRGRKAKDEE